MAVAVVVVRVVDVVVVFEVAVPFYFNPFFYGLFDVDDVEGISLFKKLKFTDIGYACYFLVLVYLLPYLVVFSV